MLAEIEMSSFCVAVCGSTDVWLYADVMVVDFIVPVVFATVIGPCGMYVSTRDDQSYDPWSFIVADMDTSWFVMPVMVGFATLFLAKRISVFLSTLLAVAMTTGPTD